MNLQISLHNLPQNRSAPFKLVYVNDTEALWLSLLESEWEKQDLPKQR